MRSYEEEEIMELADERGRRNRSQQHQLGYKGEKTKEQQASTKVVVNKDRCGDHTPPEEDQDAHTPKKPPDPPSAKTRPPHHAWLEEDLMIRPAARPRGGRTRGDTQLLLCFPPFLSFPLGNCATERTRFSGSEGPQQPALGG